MLSRGVGKHIAVTLVILSDDDDAGFIGIFTRGHRGIDRDHDSRQVWSCRHPRGIDHRLVPQRAWCVLEQFGVEFLPTKTRAFVFADDLVEEPGRQVRPIFVSRASRHHDITAFAGEQLADQLGRPRRRCHQTARVTPQSQPELQHVPSLRP